MTLAVSDLKVSESGDLVIVSNTRSRNSLPDSTCVAIAGHFGFEHGRPKLILRAKPELLFSEKTGRTIEGLERGAEGWILVTEDDGSAAFKTFQPAEAQLFDGRVNFTRRDPRLSQAEIALVGAELFRRASHPVLKRRLDPLEPTLGDFEVQDRVEGSFTRADARQQAYLYRYSSTNGLVITEQDEVVAHYSGDPGDYAHFIASHRAPDLNDDGLDEIVLVCANDDSSDLYAHVFSLGPSGASHLGGATLFTSTNLPAGGVMASQETAYRGVATGSALAGQRYVRLADGSWSAQGESEWLQLEDAGRFLLRRLDDGRGL